ncbi:MAG: Phage tail sheath protein [Candidatus Accumulibacter appositus]|uniref:Phage tail sheath protein n=1 Tax=Candidatus Accumulibacter appositus TaxID=1454003 RepID=A0A011NTT3_9PROT|nr:phage tail sheath subtilisin-like domain-containing protein [Accumulibacter sp.]EXI78776.1 MAG: Phage tail sheath protein [Candidatus Accumulibacter appositus]HRF05786.1 phage tail sheath subtilisin-like domain-containing protein [Accumulibacter sp.]
MSEMIVPGTYIDVRAEGLISAAGVATGVVGVIGTARSGPIGVPVTLSGFSQARELFGLPDSYAIPEDGSHPLTLVRALQLVYANGASTVVAVRVASPRSASASYALKDRSGNTVALLAAATPGSWGNDIQVAVGSAKTAAQIVAEKQATSFSALAYHRVLPNPQNRLQVLRGDTRRVDSFDLVYRFIVSDEAVAKNAGGFQLAHARVATVPSINAILILDSSGAPLRAYGANPPSGVTAGTIIYDPAATPAVNEVRLNPLTGELSFAATQAPTAGQVVRASYAVDHDDPLAGEVLITVWNGDLDFHSGEAPRAAAGDLLTANYLVEAADCVELTLTHGQVKESYVVPDGHVLARLAAGSKLVRVVADASHGKAKPQTDVAGYFGTGSNIGGANGADAGEDEYAAGLEAISNRVVNLVVLAGQDARSMGSVLVGHLKSTEETDLERIGIIGAPGTQVSDFLGHNLADGRVVIVAPGIRNADGSSLPPAYTAAAVAGLMAAQSVQTSLTNKAINIPGIAVEANRGEQAQLIQRNVLSIVSRQGLRVLKGITSEGAGQPFSAIPTRRIVDYAKYGVRSAANPYIGRLNNSRVRAALKATLDAFLTGMVLDEALTAYMLEVSATRAQEIAGQVNVVMTIQPTFSIDFIRVVMTLQ